MIFEQNVRCGVFVCDEASETMIMYSFRLDGRFEDNGSTLLLFIDFYAKIGVGQLASLFWCICDGIHN